MKKKFIASAVSFGLFLLLILLVKLVDVAAVGPEGTEIGLSRLNVAIHEMFGEHLGWYKITEILGYLAILVALGFAAVGGLQLIYRRSVLKVEGQNCFSSHFREFLQPLLRLRVEELLVEEVPQIVYDFVADGIVCAIERWLLEKNCISPEEFLLSLKKLVQVLFKGLERRISSDPKWLE